MDYLWFWWNMGVIDEDKKSWFQWCGLVEVKKVTFNKTLRLLLFEYEYDLSYSFIRIRFVWTDLNMNKEFFIWLFRIDNPGDLLGRNRYNQLHVWCQCSGFFVFTRPKWLDKHLRCLSLSYRFGSPGRSIFNADQRLLSTQLGAWHWRRLTCSHGWWGWR